MKLFGCPLGLRHFRLAGHGASDLTQPSSTIERAQGRAQTRAASALINSL